jgi:hydroxymethylbilane synthase
VPLAAYASLNGEQLSIHALVATPDGKTIYRAELQGASDQPEQLGFSVAQDLIAQGEGEILARLAESS